MKIAVIGHTHFPISQPFLGGLEAHTHQMIAELHQRGHDITLFAKKGSKADAAIVPIFSGNSLWNKNPLYKHSYHKIMRSINNENYDLIINNSLESLVLALHTPDMTPMITIFHTPPLKAIVNVLTNQESQSNRSYIAVSDFTAKQWQQYCPDPINVVCNGMKLSSWIPEFESAHPITAAWVGRITPEKGTHVAIEACLQAGIHLTVCGPVYDKEYFSSKIKPLLAHEGITYIGHLNHAGVNELFANASVALVTPLWDEPFGLVQIEAWASGTPVAALPNGALPSLVTKDVGCLAASNTATDLVAAIKTAAKADRRECRQYADTNFSLSAMVDAYMSHIPVPVEETVPADLLWQSAQI